MIAARRRLEERTDKLDVLINNAGILGGVPQQASAVTDAQLRQVFETNAFGAIRMVRHFLDLLQASAHPAHRQCHLGAGVAYAAQ